MTYIACKFPRPDRRTIEDSYQNTLRPFWVSGKDLFRPAIGMCPHILAG